MKLLLSIVIALCFSLTLAQDVPLSGMLNQRDEGSGVKVFDKNGKPFAKRVNKYQRPKVIVDTVKIVSGWAQVTLNDRFRRLQHRTSATSERASFPTVTPLLLDTTKTVYYYAATVKDDGKRIVIKSSGGTADTGVVVLHCYVR